MNPVQYEWILANSDSELTHFLTFSLSIRSNSPLILVTLYCMQPSRCLCRNWCLNRCNNWENNPTKICKKKLDVSKMVAKRFQLDTWLWLVSHVCVTSIGNWLFSPDPRWRRRFSSEVSWEVWVNYDIWAAARQNQQNNMCAQWRLRSAWASAQSDQSVRLRSMGSWGPNVSSCGQGRLWSDWADTQADLSLRWAHMSFCIFCHATDHIMLHETKTEIWSLFWSIDKSRR